MPSLVGSEMCIRDRSYIEQINKFEKDVKAWAHFDKKLLLAAAKIAPQVSWGTSPGMVSSVDSK